MKTMLLAALVLSIAAPVINLPTAQAQSASPAPVQGISGLSKGLPVLSSDGARVGEVAHLYGRTAYGPNDTFFVLAPLQLLRRIYGREAFIENGQVKLRMTAAQFRARNQNPPDWVNGVPPRR